MYGQGLAFGFAGGLLMALFAVGFAILGLTPSLSWIPEVPLLAAAVIVPVGILLVTGHRAYARTLDVVAAMLAGSLAGALGGLTGGVSYVVAGKSAVNVVGGLLAGVVAGVFLGWAGALVARWRPGEPSQSGSPPSSRRRSSE